MVDASDFANAPARPITGTGYHVNGIVADRVDRLIAAAPPDLQPDLRRAISSGERTHAQQAVAYINHLRGGGLAAAPGHSWHERAHGMAVDWNHVTPRGWAYLRANAGQFGLGFPLGSRDPYHMQPVETYSGNVNARAASHMTGLRELVGRFEGGGSYTTGYGNVDISKAKLNQYGFPIWDGKTGPKGKTHAAGFYGFEPDEWARYAGPLGIKDFSRASQDRVFEAAVKAEGLKPWRSNARLMAALGASGVPLSAYDSVEPEDDTPLPVKPIAQVPFPGAASDTSLGRVIATKPTPMEPPGPPIQLRPGRIPHAPSLSGTLGRALSSIRRLR